MTEKDFYYNQGQGYPGMHPSGGMEMMPPPPSDRGQPINEQCVPLTGNAVIVKGQQHVAWSWCSSGFSIIALWCCCPLFGFFGLLCSVLSYTDHKVGDQPRASYKKKCAWCWTVTSILAGLAVYILIAVYYYQFVRWIEQSRKNSYDIYGNN